MIGRTGKLLRRLAVFSAVCPVAVIGFGASPASAHPLGNFSVNHLNTLTFTGDEIVNDVVIDIAEIPTAQDRPAVDTDSDGSISPAERADHSARGCADFVATSTLTIGGVATPLVVQSASYEFEQGQAGLDTSRLECRLTADLPTGAIDPVVVDFEDGYRPGRVGWHEINAVGQGSTIVDSPVPTSSVTNGLRSYPVELLESPVDVRTARFEINVGVEATPADSAEAPRAETDIAANNAQDSRDSLVASRPGALGGFVDRVQDTFDDMIGRRDLTLGVGMLAIGLALLLGASHALLPGHGKTVMAAYIAGRQGSVRDAVLVGLTVTATHTGGVLLLGLGLTISTSLAGESVLGWLGVISGAIVAALGLALLISAIRNRGTGSLLFGHGHSHGPHGHSHHHADHVHVHDHDHPTVHSGEVRETVIERGALLERVDVETEEPDHHHDDHHHDHGDHHHHHDHRRVSRRGLVGMGVAGGLVPSPSALIVLLSAIALGRTWFGVVLVVGYGLGMAATLTAAGILLVRLRDRLADRLSRSAGLATSIGRTWSTAIPYVTASLVLVVGLGLAVRSFTEL